MTHIPECFSQSIIVALGANAIGLNFIICENARFGRLLLTGMTHYILILMEAAEQFIMLLFQSANCCPEGSRSKVYQTNKPFGEIDLIRLNQFFGFIDVGICPSELCAGTHPALP